MPTQPEQLHTNLWRLECPSHTLPPFTHTNSYLMFSQGQAAVVDPGFYEQEALEIILQTLESTNSRLTSILLTHTHPDHQEGIRFLESVFPGIPVYVHELEQTQVKANQVMTLGEFFVIGDLELEVIFTPGHSPGHVSFYFQDTAMVGDIVAGYGSTWIGWPDGNYKQYFASLEKLKALNCNILAPAHGPMIQHPIEKLEAVAKHRLQRLEQVYMALEQPMELYQLAQAVYPDLAASFQSAIKGSLLALLEKLLEENRVEKIDDRYKQRIS